MMQSTPHHSFDVYLAEKYGIHEAILIHHFQHWIRVNKNLKRNFHDERTWTYQTLQDIASNFSYFSYDQVMRIVNKLIEKGILIKGNYNKTKFDRTVWYAFKCEDLFIAKSIFEDAESRNDEAKHLTSKNSTQVIDAHHFAKVHNGTCEIATPIPDTKTNTKTKNKVMSEQSPDSTPSPSKIKKYKLSRDRPDVVEFAEEVHLKQKEYDTLLSSKFHDDKALMKEAIEKLNNSKLANAKTYADDYRAMLSWVVEAVIRKNQYKKTEDSCVKHI